MSNNQVEYAHAKFLELIGLFRSSCNLSSKTKHKNNDSVVNCSCEVSLSTVLKNHFKLLLRIILNFLIVVRKHPYYQLKQIHISFK